MIAEYQIHEIIIMRLIELRKLREVLKFIREYLEMDLSETRCTIIFPIIYVVQIANEVNSDSWN